MYIDDFPGKKPPFIGHFPTRMFDYWRANYSFYGVWSSQTPYQDHYEVVLSSMSLTVFGFAVAIEPKKRWYPAPVKVVLYL
jgi:hypothetical protein